MFSDRTWEDGNLADDVEGFGDMTLEMKYRFLELAVLYGLVFKF